MRRVKPKNPVLRKDHPLAWALCVYYPFHEGSGTVTRDVIHGDPIALSGNPSWTASPWGPCLSFNGSSQTGLGTDAHWVGTIDPDWGNVTNVYASLRSRTLICLFSSNAAPLSSLQVIFVHGSMSGSRCLGMGIDASSNFFVDTFYGSPGSPTIASISDNSWHTGIAWIWSEFGTGSQDHWRVGLDTVASMTDVGYKHTYTEIEPQWPPGAQIANKSSANYFNGSIGCIAEWDSRLLSDAEIGMFLDDPYAVVRPRVPHFIFPSPTVTPSIAPLASYYYSMISRA